MTAIRLLIDTRNTREPMLQRRTPKRQWRLGPPAGQSSNWTSMRTLLQKALAVMSICRPGGAGVGREALISPNRGFEALAIAALLGCAIAPATAQAPFAPSACRVLPEPVKSYMRSNPGWSVVDLENLDQDDRMLWLKNRGKSCPGMVAVRLDGDGKLSYALALLRPRGNAIQQKNIVLRPTKTGFRPVVMVARNNPGPVHVLTRADPGSYTDFYNGHKVRIPHDGICYENISASVEVFYLVKEKFRSILISD